MHALSKLPSLGKIQTQFICTVAIWIPSSTLQYLLCNFYGWMWSSAISFLSVLWWRGVSKLIRYRLTGEFWINSTAWDFDSLYSYWKSSEESSVFFLWAKKSFSLWNCSPRNSTLFSSRWRAPGLFWNATKAATFRRNLKYIFYSMVKEITLLKGNLCIYECLIDV